MTFSPDTFLNQQRVREVYARCYRNEGQSSRKTTVTAWLLRHTFSIMQLHRSREDVIRMLLSLKPEFRADVSGGGSVTQMIFLGNDTVWTTDQSDIEKLIALGLAEGLVSFCAPRDKWDKLPGGLPYVRVDITALGVTVH